MRHTGIAQTTSKDPLDLVTELIQKGVVLWVNKGELHYRAPKGLLTSIQLEALHRARSSIASLLEREPRPQQEVSGTQQFTPCRAPLSYTQLAHWHLYGQSGGRSLPLASATRLQGKLIVELLKDVTSELVRRHDALRTHIKLYDDVPVQEIATTAEHVFKVVNLEPIQQSGWDVVIQNNIERALVPVKDYAVDPLFKTVLLRLSEKDHVLILALDHIISDGYSLSLLSSELWTAYTQRLNGKSIELPKIGMQFAEYALRQRAQSRLFVDASHVQRRRFNRTRFPDNPCGPSEGGRRCGVSRFWISAELLLALRKWAHTNRTTLVMAVFTAYAAAVLRWCNVSETVIKFAIDGRMNAEVDHTVGYFAFPLFVKIILGDRDRFVDLLKTVTAEYCKASDDADFGFSESQLPRPGFTRNTSFNWLRTSCDVGGVRLDPPEHAIRRSRFDFALPPFETAGLDLDFEPVTVLSERDEGIFCEVHFAQYGPPASAIERFERLVIGSVVAMLRTPELCVADLEKH